MPMQAAAQAQPNIALIKYWGKRDERLNVPAVPSLSITLESLWTRTQVRFDETLGEDRFMLDGKRDDAQFQRVSAMLERLRHHAGVSTFADVRSFNNFPTGAGLASSASGFAALVVAAIHALGLVLPLAELSALARQGSASAARSIFGGFVEMACGSRDDGQDAIARPLLAASSWPLEVAVAITAPGPKSIGSSMGMVHTARTSPFYRGWIEDAPRRLEVAREAVIARDFERLAEVSEASCLAMHGLALSASPGLLYWNGVTVELMHCVRELRSAGTPVFFTVDAGPQLKAVCLPGWSRDVAQCLAEVPGVREVRLSGLGDGARVLESKEAI
ncbi:diphosphomevalonate decarboxylase [Litchfieldella qijiaojingensis]|uniref:diphosphomevalonate decarboxylase n=1 Tax=Litchfieldella qijiaojingensis TaxID=980347 RepID=A0ABQ2Z3W1_9GAMM|nr:diphosphomevalonate decarboxylase [Halomonas qijiaojingensis]GGY01676.1 diphosphomevalonate decarboxylase [Halomonas qijiaojingensis]